MKLQIYFLLICGFFFSCDCITTDEARSPPNILYPNGAITIYKQELAFTVNCTATGVPQPTYKWKKSDADIDSTGGYVTFDSNTGVLKFNSFGDRDEGDYRCYASNYFDGPGGRTTAVSLSQPVTVKKIRFDSQAIDQINLPKDQYSYVKINCGTDKIVAVAEFINYNWYTGSQVQQMSLDGGRVYVDQLGNLHITYLKLEDASNGLFLKCGLSTDVSKQIVFGTVYNLIVSAVTNPAPVAPRLEYYSQNIIGIRFQSAKLECVFSGYDPLQPLPKITWTLDDNTIIQNNNKYTVSADGRSLTVSKLEEKDERNYYCKAKNTVGESGPQGVMLNVTSKPIFLDKKAPIDVTVSQGKDAHIPCEARSASTELSPSPARWYINGIQTGSHTDRNKFDIQPGSLTIKSVKKPNDIMCVQCVISNSIGEVMGEACVNVIMPITVTQQPATSQEIDQGDSIDLTVTATTDVSEQLKYKWTHYKNKSLLVGEEPKFTFFDQTTRQAYINTTGMSDAEYDSIRGYYICEIYHLYDSLTVEIHVTLKDKPSPEEIVVSEAGFDWWIIGLIIGILFLIIVIIIIIFVICRKQQEGDYNVDKKETRAGLDPEKELKDKGFNEYSRPAFEDYDYPDKKPKVDLEYDDVPIGGDDESLGEYGDEEDTHFNEDGSFIGIYDKKVPPKPPTQTTESTI